MWSKFLKRKSSVRRGFAFPPQRSALRAPQGIGKAVVEELAALGACVLTCSRSEKDIATRVEVQ